MHVGERLAFAWECTMHVGERLAFAWEGDKAAEPLSDLP